jgi:hypothetical protein
MAAVFGTITMWLWNALLPPLFGLPVLSWLQAAGLLVLCRVLFGGITGGLRGDGGRRGGANPLRHGWDTMSDEQRKNLAEEIKKRHGFVPRGGFDDWLNSRKRDDTGETTGPGKDENENDNKQRND